MEFILNEYSLNGQYSSLEEFVRELKNTVGCINIIRKNPEIRIAKNSDFYKSKISADKCVSDLSTMISMEDELKSFQLTLDNEVYDSPPYWDHDYQQNIEAKYYWGNNDVSTTGMAEAAVTNKQLLSFRMSGLIDSEIQIDEVTNDEQKNAYCVDSIFTVRYLIEKYGSEIGLSRDEILKERYRGTRIDYTTIENGYGADILQESEYLNLIGTLDKFVKHESFATIALDDGLEYKKYSPNQKKKDWFSAGKYRRLQIMKIRCSDVLRVFGYRKNDLFRVLRIERNHKISDNG